MSVAESSLPARRPWAPEHPGSPQVGTEVLWRLRRAVSHRGPAWVAAGLMVVAGLAFMFTWGALRGHPGVWATQGDLWGILRAAHFVMWGDIGGVYTPGNGVVAFPALPVLLAPVAWLCDALNLSQSVAPYFLPRPSAALLLEPVELLLASVVVFGADALAERLAVCRRRRCWLVVVTGVLAWPVAALWGHAEDLVATGLAMYSFAALIDGRWKRAGWLLGIGIAFQPLVALLAPLAMVTVPAGRRVWFAVRSACLSVALVGLALISDAPDTIRALVQQPTSPAVNYPTPWASVAPRIVPPPTPPRLLAVLGHGHAVKLSPPVTMVAAGPGRTLDVICALLVAGYAWRRPGSPLRLVWCAALVLGLRCTFEAVMTPYYVTPALVVAAVVVAGLDRRRFVAASAVAGATSVLAYFHADPWLWWSAVSVGMGGVLLLSYPSATAVDVDEEGEEERSPVRGGGALLTTGSPGRVPVTVE